jgi:alkanesulfonate monooxygenase SsuD/methylene tetrahydromethanopterin reductase-like flavin-dependent oxidoreductase (luciferase family)
VLSRGRVILGVGSGWCREEFEALATPFERRGYRTNEYIELLKALWSEDHVNFAGDTYSLGDVGFYPKPVQQPGIPIWTAGESPMALRRAARLADGYHPVQHSNITFENAVENYARVKELASEYGRDPASIRFTLHTRVNLQEEEQASVIARFQKYRDAGVEHVVINFRPTSEDEARQNLQSFAKEIMPLVR